MMFMRVVLPAPFSPRSATISPLASSRSIPSLASRLPKRLVMPDRRRTGLRAVTGTSMTLTWFYRDLPLWCGRLPSKSAAGGRFGIVDLHLEGAVEDLLLPGLDLVDHLLRHQVRIHGRQRAAAILHVAVLPVVLGLEGPFGHRLDGPFDRRLHVPESGGDDRARVVLLGVDDVADRLHAAL